MLNKHNIKEMQNLGGKIMEKKRPIIAEDKYLKGATVYRCPRCEKPILGTHNMRCSGHKANFCSKCGQELDWTDVKIETYFPM